MGVSGGAEGARKGPAFFPGGRDMGLQAALHAKQQLGLLSLTPSDSPQAEDK